MKHERYIISEEEVELLDRYEGSASSDKDPSRYDRLQKEALAMLCRMKDRSNDMFLRRNEAAHEVIDMIAKRVGIDPDNCGEWLYAPYIGAENEDGGDTCAILRRLDEYLSRAGEKAQLKKRVKELEQENAVLRSLIQK
ncbi:MAG: hypothetical protein IIY93_11550 [Clostridia bacterium]|nr:hypothetical protein [Clostridia bacterium]